MGRHVLRGLSGDSGTIAVLDLASHTSKRSCPGQWGRKGTPSPTPSKRPPAVAWFWMASWAGLGSERGAGGKTLTVVRTQRKRAERGCWPTLQASSFKVLSSSITRDHT